MRRIFAFCACFALTIGIISASSAQTFKMRKFLGEVQTGVISSGSLGSQTAEVGHAFSFTIPSSFFRSSMPGGLSYTATRADGSALPAWLSFASATRTFSGTPLAQHEETSAIKVTARNTAGNAAYADLSIVVSNPAPSVLTPIPDHVIAAFQPFSFTIDPDTFSNNPSELLTLTATLSDGAALPVWIFFNDILGSFEGTAPASGSITLRVTATDEGGSSESDHFVLTINNPAPVLANAIPDQSGTALVAFSYVVPTSTFADNAGDTLTWSALKTDGTALPTWLSFNTGTRTFSGTPADMGTTSVRLTVTDTSGNTVSDDFNIAIGQDSTPDTFTLAAITGVAPGTLSTLSSPVTISGFSDSLTASVSGSGSPQISVNGGTWAGSASITAGNTLSVRLTASASFNTGASATVTIGGTSATFSVTTAPQDTTPDTFTFTAVTNAVLSSTQTSNTATISGITGSVPISITEGSYKIDSGAYTTSAGTITNGQTVTLQTTSSASYSTAKNVILTIGSVSATWTVTTTADTPPASTLIAQIWSTSAVGGGGTSPSFTITKAWTVTGLYSYHWNGCSGSTPGTVSIQHSNGTTYGPFQTTGVGTWGCSPNIYWQAETNVVIPAGTWTFIDSNPSTWSTNASLSYKGMCQIVGY
ncbi:MAG TPA: hypothetical protein DCW68_07405 [Rhodospirillaceae bacterium]|nr:MAG: hypothetical protein A2018_06915 [Alphaproteobacteria bacterium GWF2_58_20]HAU29913.1 hypothetical protein [Rhodospirillaceae bacterium]